MQSRGVSRLLGDSSAYGAALSWLEGEEEAAVPSSEHHHPLLRLVELVGNVTQCVTLDRFLGFDTEAELEAAAATLHDRREFIAGMPLIHNMRKHVRGLPMIAQFEMKVLHN